MLTKEELIVDAIQNGIIDNIEELTCYDCSHNDKCPLAWDLCNTSGDCLMIK